MDVKIIGIKKQAAIVESIEEEHVLRRVVPTEILRCKEPQANETCIISRENWEAGIEYGLPWEELIPADLGLPQRIANELHRYGVWTAQDLYANPRKVAHALRTAFNVEYGRLVQLAKEAIDEHSNS